MDRRSFLKAGAAAPAAAALPGLALAQELPFNPRQAETWRSFESRRGSWSCFRTPTTSGTR